MTARWAGSLEWEAQQSASSFGSSPNRSAAPSMTIGMAWNGLAAERQKVSRLASPTRATSRPAASTTATITR